MKFLVAWIGVIVYSQVVVVDDESINHALGSSKYALVNFYSPYCKVCQKFADEYETAERIISEAGLPVEFYKIDATAELESVKHWNVTGYHHILWFEDGKLAAEYNGTTFSYDLIPWIKRKLKPEPRTK